MVNRLRAFCHHVRGFFDGSSRSDEIACIRLRLTAEISAGEYGSRELQLATDLRAMRERMLPLISPVEACRTCAKGFPLPNGRWDGGYCCGGTTENVFSQSELAALGAAGTQPKDLTVRQFHQAGCVFRGPTGCALPPAHRPNLCVRYACRILNEEYEKRGVSTDVKNLASQIQRAFNEFDTLRAARLEREAANALERAMRKKLSEL